MRRTESRRFPLRRKLLLFIVLLIPLPWLIQHYIDEMKRFLIAGQENAQLLAAQAIAGALHARTDLFAVDTRPRETGDAGHAFYAWPLDTAIRIDGYAEDWGELAGQAVRYTAAATQFRGTGDGSRLAFSLVMGTHGDYLYCFIRVEDDRVVYRHPGYRRLDNSDHLRLSLIDADGETRRYVLLAEGPGRTSAYAVGPDWKYAESGRSEPRLRGRLQTRQDGYNLELRIPLAAFGARKRLHLAVADVDATDTRRVTQVLGTLPGAAEPQLNPVVLRSPELERILRGLQRAPARIWILDRERRVRAASPAGASSTDPARIRQRNETAVHRALAGETYVGRQPARAGRPATLIATHPILNGSAVLGAVVVEQDIRRILALQRETLWRVTLISAGVLITVILALTLFSSRLTYRIQRLSTQTRAAIDSRGRIRHSMLSGDRHARDEIGMLSRSISALLERLAGYTRFLERMPRTLRHELNNPLNVISTSLENLAQEHPGLETEHHLHSARRGVVRINELVRALTEASSLEESLHSEQTERLDLGALVAGYAEHARRALGHCRLETALAPEPLYVRASDLRLEQLLDKLLDNAAGYCPRGGVVAIALRREAGEAHLSVSNTGPALDPDMRENLFGMMVTDRGSSPEAPHFGLGLYIVRLISEFHGGRVWAENTGDGVSVHLLLALLKDAE